MFLQISPGDTRTGDYSDCHPWSSKLYPVSEYLKKQYSLRFANYDGTVCTIAHLIQYPGKVRLPVTNCQEDQHVPVSQ